MQLPPDRRPHAILVDAQHTDKYSQITRPMWEPTSELEAEIAMFETFLGAEYLAKNHRARQNLAYYRAWLEGLFEKGQSVDGWKTDRTVAVLTKTPEQAAPNAAGGITIEGGKAQGGSGGWRRELFN